MLTSGRVCLKCLRQCPSLLRAANFKPNAFTDGERNEEKMPDVRYRWVRPG
jgi:hypothetical protein